MPSDTPAPEETPVSAADHGPAIPLVHAIHAVQLEAVVVRRLAAGTWPQPHQLLGVHRAVDQGTEGAVFRALSHGATACSVQLGDARPHRMSRVAPGLFQLFVPDSDAVGQGSDAATVPYRLGRHFADGTEEWSDDPYRFAPTLGAMDLHLIGEGRHLELWKVLGAQLREIDGVAGTAFAVWAPSARGVSVIGSFNGWDAAAHPMRRLNNGGVWELFIPAVREGATYKFDIRPLSGASRVKTDPLGFAMEQQPGSASIVTHRGRYHWGDATWMDARAKSDPTIEPLLAYEVHLGSWRRATDGSNRALTYREIAPQLAEHCTRLGFTHVELMPVQEHPYGGSWGYQVSGYYAPTSRYGTPDDFRFFVDTLHQAGIGVLLDWVPAHFPKDDWALRRFDGTACYEHADPRLAEHPEWGTLIFNYGRHEVRNFLLANALYWAAEFHIDGLRVDAVASMLYLDYGREAGQWMRNRLGGRENLEAVSFLRELNVTLQQRYPGVVTIAEESTTWPKVTHAVRDGGLGFTFKWNMGWMHDTLDYFRVDPLFRSGAHNQLTFAMMYEYSERFVNPLSHDEVVHLKRSLLQKMPGDRWRKFANLRVLLAYAILRPGKTVLFMGTELAPEGEWNHDVSLDWASAHEPRRAGFLQFFAQLGAVYRGNAPFWKRDHEPSGFSWIDVGDREQSVVSFVRRDGQTHAVVVLNLTPVPRVAYQIGAPESGAYRYALSSDDAAFGGSGHERPDVVNTDEEPYHGFAQSMRLTLPPLSVVVLLPDPGTEEALPLVAAPAEASPQPRKPARKAAARTATKTTAKQAAKTTPKQTAKTTAKQAAKTTAKQAAKTTANTDAKTARDTSRRPAKPRDES